MVKGSGKSNVHSKTKVTQIVQYFAICQTATNKKGPEKNDKDAVRMLLSQIKGTLWGTLGIDPRFLKGSVKSFYHAKMLVGAY